MKEVDYFALQLLMKSLLRNRYNITEKILSNEYRILYLNNEDISIEIRFGFKNRVFMVNCIEYYVSRTDRDILIQQVRNILSNITKRRGALFYIMVSNYSNFKGISNQKLYNIVYSKLKEDKGIDVKLLYQNGDYTSYTDCLLKNNKLNLTIDLLYSIISSDEVYYKLHKFRRFNKEV